MSLEQYYEEHKPKMPKLVKGATKTSKKDAADNSKKDIETGEEMKISEVRSISSDIDSEVQNGVDAAVFLQ